MRGKHYMNLANDDVQSGRAAITVSVTNRVLHDYVPLYFGFKTPMVACNQNHNENLLFIRVSLEVLEKAGVVFTDGNARTRGTRFFQFAGIDDLSAVDAGAINTTKYAGNFETKRRKQAEILVPDFLPITDILDIMAFSEDAKTRALAIVAELGKKIRVLVNPGIYFRPTKTGATTT